MSLREFDAVSGAPLPEASEATEFATIAIDLIVASSTNPRRTFDEAKLKELAASIASIGVVQPVTVRPLPIARLEETSIKAARKDKRPAYELVSGERRWRASQIAGKTSIPAIVRQMTDAQVLEVQLVENLQRDDLHPLEEAEGYRRLCEATGIRKEDIAGKIGKGRSYVYQRLQLLNLAAESREAFRAGRLDASKASLLATVADTKLQLKALKEVTAEGYNGRSMTFRDFRDWLEQNVMLKLDHAPFDIADATLAEAAGACGTCPKRTGVDRDIFAAFNSPELCTDAKCYGNKATVSLERVKAAAAAQGMKVIAGVEAKKLKPSSYTSAIKGYTRLDEKIEGGSTVAKALGKNAPLPTLFIDPHTRETIKVLPSEVVGDLLKDRKAQPASVARVDHSKEQEAAHRKAELERRIEETWRAKAALQIVNQVRAGAVKSLGAPVLRLVLESQLKIMRDSYECADQCEALLPLWGLPPCGEDDDPTEPIWRHVQAAPDAELGPMLFGLLLSEEVRFLPYNANAKKTPIIAQLADAAGVDAESIARDVKNEIKAEEKAKAKPAHPAGATSQAAPQASVAQGEGAPAKGRRAKKLSPEEAQLGIAEAMQQSGGPAAGGGDLPENLGDDMISRLLMLGITTQAALQAMDIDEIADLLGADLDSAKELLASLEDAT